MTLSKYAKAMGCNSIIAITENENVKSIASKFGANTNTTIIKLEI